MRKNMTHEQRNIQNITIQDDFREGRYTYTELANEYGLSRSSIIKIVSNFDREKYLLKLKSKASSKVADKLFREQNLKKRAAMTKDQKKIQNMLLKKEYFEGNKSQVQLGIKYGVSTTNVNKIVNRG